MSETKIINISKTLYKTLLSFTESSLKSEYPWNKTIITPNVAEVKFVKYRNWQRRWTLEVCFRCAEVEDNYYDEVNLSKSEFDASIIDVLININDNNDIIVYFREYEIRDPYQAETLYIECKDVIYSYPIPLSEIILKMLHYYRIAKSLKEQKTQQQQEQQQEQSN